MKCYHSLDKSVSVKQALINKQLESIYSLISRTDKVELIATELIQQSCDCLGYLEQHTKSCKSYLVGKYIFST